jgi:hypothetical protein
MQELFRTLPTILKEAGDSVEVREASVMAVWRKIAGEQLLENAVPFRLFNRALIVAVPDETWKCHLESLSGQMLFKLNAMLGQALVTFIEFRIDRQTIAAEREKRRRELFDKEHQEEIALDNVPVSVRAAADAIEDYELRYQFLLAAGSCLARKKMKSK